MITSFLYLTVGTVAAFTVPQHQRLQTQTLVHGATASTTSKTETEDETFYRAVQLAERGRRNDLDLDELDRLATELEQVQGCKYEPGDDDFLCDKEIQDRIDVAEILRLQIELQLR